MVDHILFIQVKDDTDAVAVQRMKKEVLGLEALPMVQEISCGATFTTARADNFTHAFVVRLPDRDALEAYGQDPTHLRVRDKFIKPIVSRVVCLDIDRRPKPAAWTLPVALAFAAGLAAGALVGLKFARR